MRVGEYKSVRELRRSGAASLWEVEGERSGGASKRAAKVLQPPAFWSDEERSQRVAGFLKRAAVQRSAAAVGEHWAPVHAAGEDEHGAYYVTDLYPSSAEQLIRKSKAAMDGAGLYRIIRGVVAGLAELRESAGRAHGRLAPENVLLTSENPGAASVALADPGVEPAGGEAGDCWAVGVLIFALVERRMPQAEEVAKAGSAWRALGPRGARWRELCNRLLDPVAPLDGLDALRGEVERCRPPKVSRARVIRVGVVAVLVVGAVAGYWANRHHSYVKYMEEWSVLCDAAPWFKPFVEQVNSGPDLKFILDGAPQGLKGELEVLGGLSEVRPEQLRGARDPSLPIEKDPPGDPDRMNRVKTIVRGVRAVQALCTEAGWPPLKQAEELAALYGGDAADRPRALSAKAEFVAAAGRQMGKPASVPTKGAGLDGGILARDLRDLIHDRAWIEPLYQLGGVRQAITTAAQQADDKELGDNFQRAATDALDADGPAELIALLRLAARIEDGLKDLRSDQFDAGRFRAERALRGRSGRDYLDQWLAQVPDYRKLTGKENPLEARGKVNWSVFPEEEAAATRRGTEAVGERPPASWRDLLKGMDEDIAANVKTAPEVAEKGVKAQKALEVQLAALTRKVPLVKDRDTVGPELEEFIQQAGDIRRELLKDDPKKVQAFLDGLTAEIGAAKPDDLIQAARARELWRLKASGWRLGRMKVRRDELNTFFGNLPAVPRLGVAERAGDRPWVKALSNVARGRWEAVVRGALAAAFPGGGQSLDGAGLADQGKRAREQLGQWVSRAEALGTAAAALEDRLNEYPLPDEPGSGGRSVGQLRRGLEGGEKEIIDALAPVVGRADALIGVSKRPVEQLRAAVAGGKLEELSSVVDAQLAAWRLGADRSIELDRANAVRVGLVARLKQGSGKGPPAGVFDEVEKIWKERVARPQIAAPPAKEAMTVLGEGDRLMAENPAPLNEGDLDPQGAYNLLVYRLFKAAEGKASDADLEPLKARAEQAAQAVRGVGVANAADRAQDALAEFLKRLNKSKPDASAVPVELAGPGGAGWQYVPGTDLTYRRKGKPLTLEFVYVEAPGAECYLCKTEVSIELVKEALSAGELKNLPGDTAEGPQVWVKEAGKAPKLADDWFQRLTVPKKPEPIQAYTPAAGDWTPGPGEERWKYPIQWIAPVYAERVAKSLKCSLPTVQQWKAALAAELAANPKGRWNLRDAASWQAHLRAFPQPNDVGSNPTQWPVIGDATGAKAGPNDCWMLKDDGTLAVGVGQKPYDDGHLFFQAVDFQGARGPHALVGQGKLFNHLIGNVAEYVVETENGKRRYFAMGGSAISPPMPLDEPIPLDKQLAGRGYCDVGFRLALEPPVPRLWKRLQVALGNPADCLITRTQ